MSGILQSLFYICVYMECWVGVLVTMTTSRQEWRQFVWDDIIIYFEKGYP